MTAPIHGREGLHNLADAVLSAIGERASDIAEGPLTYHWPLVGSRFDRGVLVIGQAVYGWFGDWTAHDARDPTRRDDILRSAQDLFAERPDRMDWIEGHRVWNSPFWRAARDVTDALAPGDGPFYSRLAWANLYPVAPNDTKSNPAGALLEVQTAPAASVLDAAVRDIDPSVVLIVGGPYVWPFIEPLGLLTLPRAERPLYLSGRHQGRRWIVGMHPGGASRRGWGPSSYARLIVDRAKAI